MILRWKDRLYNPQYWEKAQVRGSNVSTGIEIGIAIFFYMIYLFRWYWTYCVKCIMIVTKTPFCSPDIFSPTTCSWLSPRRCRGRCRAWTRSAAPCRPSSSRTCSLYTEWYCRYVTQSRLSIRTTNNLYINSHSIDRFYHNFLSVFLSVNVTFLIHIVGNWFRSERLHNLK